MNDHVEVGLSEDQIRKIVQSESSESFRRDVEAHRQFLERLLKHVTWAVGIVLSLIIGGGALLFGKSVEGAAAKLLDRESFREQLTTQIDEASNNFKSQLTTDVKAKTQEAIAGISSAIAVASKNALATDVGKLLEQEIESKLKDAQMLTLEQLVRSELRNSNVPIGSIVAWYPKGIEGEPLPSGWLPCDGQMVRDDSSPFKGHRVPDLVSTILIGSESPDGVGLALAFDAGGGNPLRARIEEPRWLGCRLRVVQWIIRIK